MGTHKGSENRLSKAMSAFARLRPAWKSNSYSKETKLTIYNSVVKATLMYGSECWRMCESDRKSMNSFHTDSLRRILGIHWPETLSKNKFRAIKALQWTFQGRHKVGRLEVTWRSAIAKELIEMGITSEETKVKAKDRLEWKSKVMTLCSTGNE
ncbi:endonuclease-reverse transcriptase [Brachionus plicatilis]|uniref:Endonuclease-reverse transcriptase n=1 Tax=Brachionus plicatilis TaxID=10195 RepID=A0A3M7RIT9_BRAPC|nr:endonuclease-reverse transcriptase [Brachionus plicatilis]